MKDGLGNRRLVHFTPLRYPGGKGRLAPYIKEILKTNKLVDGEYVEPYAGGAAIAMELLFHEYVSRVHINDISRSVYAFWHSVLQETDALSRLVADTPVTVEEWDRQKRVFAAAEDQDNLALGFSFFFLNRTNRSGILNAGVIGGRAQTGPWKIDARYNARELVSRIEEIAKFRSRISLTNLDAAKFLKKGKARWPAKTLVYCDPPYYVKGRDLYYHFYKHDDHEMIAERMQEISEQRWIVSYDNVPPIRQMYTEFRSVTYDIGYSARSTRQGSEVMFFSRDLKMPKLVGAIEETSRSRALTKAALA